MLLKAPSFIGLQPGMPVAAAIGVNESKLLLDILQRDGEIVSLCFENNINNHFILTENSGTIYYIKALSPREEQRFDRIEAIKQYLCSDSYKTSNALFSARGSYKGHEYLFLGYQYIEGRRFSLASDELKLLGRNLGNLHNNLRNIPQLTQVKQNTKRRYDELSQVRLRLLNDDYRDMPYKIDDSILKLAERYDFSYFQSGYSSVTHGDLNAGNFLITPDNKICFLDFEDVLHSYQPVAVELAYIVERLILIKECEVDNKLNYIVDFLESYYQVVGGNFFRQDDFHILYYLTLRAFCIILFLTEKGIEIDDAEWQKFVFLHKVAVENEILIKTMMRPYLI